MQELSKTLKLGPDSTVKMGSSNKWVDPGRLVFLSQSDDHFHPLRTVYRSVQHDKICRHTAAMIWNVLTKDMDFPGPT